MEITLFVSFVSQFCTEIEVQLQPFRWWTYTKNLAMWKISVNWGMRVSRKFRFSLSNLKVETGSGYLGNCSQIITGYSVPKTGNAENH